MNKIKRRNRLCATMGHIAFHIGLATLGAIFSYVMTFIAEHENLKTWYYELVEAIKHTILSITGDNMVVQVLLLPAFAAVVLLLIPFIVTLIAKIGSALMKGRSSINRPNGIHSEKQEAELLLKEIEAIEKYDSYDAWDDYYPINAVDVMFFDFNTFNFIPWLTFSLSSFLCFLVGVETVTGEYIGCILFSLLISFILLLIVVPLWKLSSIINATLYKGRSGVSYIIGNYKKEIKEFIHDCEIAEEQQRKEAEIAKEKENKEAQDKILLGIYHSLSFFFFS